MSDTKIKTDAAPVAPAETDAEKIARRLAEPFDVREVKCKPMVVSGTRALGAFYVDARVIQDRLDDVLGVAGWSDEYESLPDGGVVCRLRCKFGDVWITKMDVGSTSEQPDEGDRRKAAFSDALKRAAVKFGVGRYLYRIPSQWCDYDPQKKQFVKAPQVPPSAMKPRQAAVVAGRERVEACLGAIERAADPAAMNALRKAYLADAGYTPANLKELDRYWFARWQVMGGKVPDKFAAYRIDPPAKQQPAQI
jgi:hypothetical protein